MTEYIKRQTYINLSVGGIVWCILFFLYLAQWSFLSQIHLLILFGIAILTPLSVRLAIPIARDDTIHTLAHIILRIQPIIPLLAVVSLLLSQGEPAAALASGWLLQSLLLALFGVIRWVERSTRTLAELCVDVGLVLSSVSGIWFFFYRLSGNFFGFTGVLVPLTAAHFVTIGMGALMIAGMIGRQLPSETKVYRGIAWITMISPVIVAIGITHTNLMDGVSPIEVVGVILLSTSFVSLASYYLIKVRSTIGNPLASLILGLSALTLFVTMALALGYSVGRFTTWFVFAIPDMVQWHGWLNALGFAGLGVLGWNLVMPQAKGNPHHIPFSRLSGGLRIGATYFESKGMIDDNRRYVNGLVDDLSTYASQACQVSDLSPRLINFYENTADHHLYVYPQWAKSFTYPARFYKWFARRVNQMNLPLEPESEETTIHSRIVPLVDHLDGRKKVRGWVRTYGETDEVVYVAAYSSHEYNQTRYMNIAFPLPFGNITSILKLKTFLEHDRMSLSLYSINSPDDVGDQGVYFVTRWLTFRLPFNEVIDVYLNAPDDLPSDILFREQVTLFARHRMWLFGYSFLTLYYMIWLGE